MMTTEDLETQLECLAGEWPAESVADAVAGRVKSETAWPLSGDDIAPEVLSSPSFGPEARRSYFYPAIGLLTTCLAGIVAAAWLLLPQTLHAALQQSLRKSNSWHVTIEASVDEGSRRGEVWFHREHGFRTELDGQVTVDNGTKSFTWSTTAEDSIVLLRPSMDGIAMVAEMCDLSRVPRDWKKQRDTTLDRLVGTEECSAYLLVRNEQPGIPQGAQQRMIVLVDDQTRPRQMIHQTFENSEWKQQRVIAIDYEHSVPGSVFKPDYPEGAKVVDVQSALDERFPLSAARAVQQKDGLIFAVHDLVPIDDGTWYSVTSVRGTPEYLREYPPSKRRVNLNYSALDVAHQMGSHGSAGSGTQLLMFQMEWQGIDYLWRLVFWNNNLRPDHGAGPGKLRLPLYAAHMHPERQDSRGVQLATLVDIDVPVDTDKPLALEDVIARARLDMKLAGHVAGETGALRVAISMRNQTVDFVSFDDISDAEYAKEMLKARWQMQTGNWRGDDPPVDWVATIPDADDVEPEPEPMFSDEPRELQPKVTGTVVDLDGTPVAKAKVIVRLRRFSKKNDGEEKGPGPWSAVTDAEGRYSIAPTGTIRPNHDEVRIRVSADGFADVDAYEYEHGLLTGEFSPVELPKGRRFTGQFVNADGEPVTKAIVRFQSSNADLSVTWDSGPFPVSRDGTFSIRAPINSKVAAAVYPVQYAPRFVEMTEEEDQGRILLSKGVSLKGRVVDRNGKGVPKAVVGIRSTDHLVLHAYVVLIGTAVRTDDNGYFQLPPLDGQYELSVGNAMADYSQQMMLTGDAPPMIEPITIDVSEQSSKDLIVLQE